MPAKLEIKPHMSVDILNTHIRKFEGDCKTANRLHLIKLAMKLGNLKEACEILDVPLKTGQNWVKKWNKNGIDGLRHKKGAGRPSFLSKKQFEELDVWMEGVEYLVTKDVYLYIKNNFNVDYSTKQVERIVKKLNYSWVSPYPIADNQADDAEEILKEKTDIIDPDNDIYGFLDETAVQNTPNVRRIIKKGSCPKIKVNPKKIKKTAIGFQAVNGKSTLKIGDNINSGIMIRFLIEIKQLNSEKKKLKNYYKNY